MEETELVLDVSSYSILIPVATISYCYRIWWGPRCSKHGMAINKGSKDLKSALGFIQRMARHRSRSGRQSVGEFQLTPPSPTSTTEMSLELWWVDWANVAMAVQKKCLCVYIALRSLSACTRSTDRQYVWHVICPRGSWGSQEKGERSELFQRLEETQIFLPTFIAPFLGFSTNFSPRRHTEAQSKNDFQTKVTSRGQKTYSGRLK